MGRYTIVGHEDDKEESQQPTEITSKSKRYSIVPEKEEPGVLENLTDPIERFKFLASATTSKPIENITAFNEGFSRIGEGIKDAELWTEGKLGFNVGEEAAKHKREVAERRKAFGETAAGRSPYGQAITQGVQMGPLLATPIGRSLSMIKNMLTGAAGFGAYEGLQFVPEGESRLGHIAKGAAIGAALPYALKLAPKIANKALDIAEPLFKGEFTEAIREANPWQLINRTDPALKGQRQQLKSQISDLKEKIPEASVKLAEMEPEVLAAQEAAELAKKEHIRTTKAAESNPMVAKSRDSAIQLDLNKADIALQDLNKARQETEQKISETTVPEPFEHDAKIAELEKSAQEKQAVADQYEADMKAKDEEFKAAQEAATENPSVGVGNKASVQKLINKGQVKKSDAERAKIAKEQEHQENLIAEHKAEQAASKATHEKMQAEANMSKAESHVKAAENEVKATDHNISQYLGKGLEHDVELAARVNAIQDAKHALASKKYTDVEAKTEGTYIEHEAEKNLGKTFNKIRKSLSKEEALSSESRSFLKRLKNIESTSARVTAKEYLELLRTAKQIFRNARNKSFSVGMRADERAAWKEKYNAYDKLVDRMSRSLERGLGKENSNLLKEANATWREDVASLYNNPTYQRMKKIGTASENVMKAIRGPAKGNVKLREIILNDPTAIKHALGQRFANKPKNLDNIGVREEQYINAVPEFKSMVEQRNAASQMAESSKLNHQTAKDAHVEAAAKEKEVHAAHEEAKTLKGKTQSALDDLNKSIDQVVKQEPELIKHRDELIRLAKEKKTTLPKKLQAESEVKEINAHLRQVKDAKVAHEKEIKTRQDEIASHTQDLEKINSDIAKYEEKIPHQKAALQDITEKANNRQIAFEEKSRVEKEKANLTKIVATGESQLRSLKAQQGRLNEKIDKSRTGLYAYAKSTAKLVPKLWRWSKKLF